MRDWKTKAIILSRTDYGEADRILNVLSEEGKVAVLAKGVRKAKSKLAGAIELLSFSELTLHEGRGKMMTLTGARLQEYYGGLLGDLAAMKLAGEMLKEVNRRAESLHTDAFLYLLREALLNLEWAVKNQQNQEVLRLWWRMRMLKLIGEELNVRTDNLGQPLVEGLQYEWSREEQSLVEREGSKIRSEHIKVLRLMSTAPASTLYRLKSLNDLLPEIRLIIGT